MNIVKKTVENMNNNTEKAARFYAKLLKCSVKEARELVKKELAK